MKEDQLAYYSSATLHQIFTGLGYVKGRPTYIYYRFLALMNDGQERERRLFDLNLQLSCWLQEKDRYENPYQVGLVMFTAFAADDAEALIAQALKDLGLMSDRGLLTEYYGQLIKAARGDAAPTAGDGQRLRWTLRRPVVHQHDSQFQPGTHGFGNVTAICGQALTNSQYYFDFSEESGFIPCPDCTRLAPRTPRPP